MITYLLKRLQAAEEAISQSEIIIRRERDYRKTINRDLKGKNKDLRDLVESERASLSEKIQNQMSSTLELAVQDRMQTQQKLTDTEDELRTRLIELSELKLKHEKIMEKSEKQALDIQNKTE